jgi:Domain of unknown function DUF29
MIQTVEALTDLYEADEIGWLETMAELIAAGKNDELDYAHLQEFLTDMAIREKREVKSRLTVLLVHLLKWTHQKRKRTASWRNTIIEQSEELADIFESRTLRNHANTVLPQAYKRAVGRATGDTGLPASTFPKKCPWTVDMLLAEDVLGD